MTSAKRTARTSTVGLVFVALIGTAGFADPYPDGSDAKKNADHIKEVTAPVVETTGRDFRVTSEQRSDSAAHQRGAVDYSSKSLAPDARQVEAKRVSEAL